MVNGDQAGCDIRVSQSILRKVFLIIKSCPYCTPRTQVCDDHWGSRGLNNTKSACYTLGYSGGTYSSSSIDKTSGYGWGSEIPILIDDLKCPSDSTNLLSCPRTEWGESDCNHKEDVILTCI